MLVHPYNINRTHQKLFQIALEAHNEQDARLHLNADVHIATLMLLATGDRAK